MLFQNDPSVSQSEYMTALCSQSEIFVCLCVGGWGGGYICNIFNAKNSIHKSL